MLMQCIDSLVQKVQSGVVIHFEKIGPDPPPIDGGTRESGDQPDELNLHDGEKDYDGDGDKNGVFIFLNSLLLINNNVISFIVIEINRQDNIEPICYLLHVKRRITGMVNFIENNGFRFLTSP